MSNTERDRPSVQQIAPMLLKSMGVRIERTSTGMKFVYKEEIVKDLDQLGFSIKILKLGGELPLSALQEHLDEQASLEAYWSSQAEEARYKMSVAQDNFNFWYECKYAEQFNYLQSDGVPKPIEKEVRARIAKQYPNGLRKKTERLRRLEKKYRMFSNCCLASIVTKGKMLQSLRNVIQGSQIQRAPSIEIEEETGSGDPDNLVVKGR